MSLSKAEAKFELSILNSKANELDKIDVVTRLTNFGLPLEVVTRIEDLWDKTKEVAGEVIHIGKVIIAEILKFIEENPNLAIGVALGASVGALTGLIPFFGPILAPIAIAIGVVVGGIAGLRLDKGQDKGEGVIGVSQDLITIAKKFYELFALIFITLQEDFSK